MCIHTINNCNNYLHSFFLLFHQSITIWLLSTPQVCRTGYNTPSMSSSYIGFSSDSLPNVLTQQALMTSSNMKVTVIVGAFRTSPLCYTSVSTDALINARFLKM